MLNIIIFVWKKTIFLNIGSFKKELIHAFKFLVLKKLVIIIVLLSVSLLGFSSSVIYGTSKEYANNKLIFYKYSDRITFTKEQMFILDIDENGNFRTEVNIDCITYVFGEFGIYHAYFYLEPEASYELLLPPFAEKEPKDLFNPYFEPERIHMGIKDMANSDLNYLIIDFDYYFDRYLDLNFFEVYFNGIESDVNTFIQSIKERYNDVDNEYFNVYKKYRIAFLKNIATQKKFEPTLAIAYFALDTILYDNPAYMDLFNNIYESYFDKYLLSKKGPLLYAVINYGHSITRMHRLLAQDIELRGSQFREMVIMKGIYDAFGNRNISWLPLLLTLDSLSISTKYEFHKDIAQNIAEKVVSMAPNTVAPVFELADYDGQNINIKEFRGKYVYLQFANTDTYSSRIEFESMKRIYERFKGVCEFITVLTDDNKEKAKRYIEKNNLEWQFLFTEINSDLISMYKVDSYPTYYLIDPYGFLKMSPAPSPSDNFESALFKLIEKEREGQDKN